MSAGGYDGYGMIGGSAPQSITKTGLMTVGVHVNSMEGIDMEGRPTKTYGTVYNPQFDNSVNDRELFWVVKDKGYSTGTFGAGGRTALTGFNLSNFRSKEDLWQHIRILGIAASNDYTTDPTQSVPTGSGVSVIMGGTGSLFNIGPDTFFPGDLVIGWLPSFKDAKRQTQLASLKIPGNSRDTNKVLIVPRRFDPKKAIGKVFSNAASYLVDTKKSLNEQKTPLIDIPEIRANFASGGSSPLSLTQQISYRIKEARFTDLVQALTVLYTKGFITFNSVSPKADVRVDKTDFENLANATPRKFNARERSFVEHLVCALGLAVSDDHAEQNFDLQQELLLQILGFSSQESFIGEEKDDDDNTPAINLVKKHFQNVFDVTDEVMLHHSSHYNDFKDTVAGQFYYECLPSTNIMGSVYGTLYALYAERIVCTATSYAPQGWMIHEVQ